MDRIGSVPFGDRTSKDGEARDEVESVEVKPTVVQVYFPGKGRTLAYYNERFDLHVGDIVFVDGKLEGLLGRVTVVSTHFKVKKEDYKQVIGLADTHVTGQFFQANGHLITFDPLVLPWKQFCSWVKPPEDDAGYYVSYDGEGFALDDLSGLEVSDAVYERGMEYHQEDRVVYLCLNGAQGRAIVKGTRPYEVEFRYRKGQIGDLTVLAAIPANMRWRCCSSSGRRWRSSKRSTRPCGVRATIFRSYPRPCSTPLPWTLTPKRY